MAVLSITNLTPEEKSLLYDFEHPAYENVHRLRQVLDNVKSFGPVVAIGQFGISFRNGVFQFFSMDTHVEDSNDYDYPSTKDQEVSLSE